MNCESAGRNISLFLYGELSLEEEQSFQDHLDQCDECRTALEKERRLHAALDAREMAPEPELVARCRRDLTAHIEAARIEAAPRRGGFRQWLERLFDVRIGALVRPAGAVALVALGFFASRWTAQPGAGIALRPVNSLEPVVTHVRYLNSEPSGRVQLLLEETRQRTVSGNAGDGQIRRLLLAAARESADAGVRAESMDLLVGKPSGELRPLLLYALQHDPNPGVRLKALDALKTDAAGPEVRDVLSRVLLTDDNPGVRAQAIDLLVLRTKDCKIGVFQEVMQKENNSYVRLRCQRALEEMNASVGTF